VGEGGVGGERGRGGWSLPDKGIFIECQKDNLLKKLVSSPTASLARALKRLSTCIEG
jgi:hypothetical protein